MTEPHETNDAPNQTDQGSDVSFGEVFRQLGPAGPASVFAAIGPAIGGFVLLGSIGIVGKWLVERGPLGVVLYIGVFALTSGFAILPTYAQAALGGWAFGAVWGTAGAVAGLTGGAIIGCLLARSLGAQHVNSTIDRYPKAAIVRDALAPATHAGSGPRGWLKTLGVITLVRIPPNSPFALTNMLLGSLRLPLSGVIIGTVVGMVPRTALVAYVASLIEGEFNKDAASAARPSWLFPVGIGVSLGVLFLLIALADRAIRRVGAMGEADEDATPSA